MVAVRLQRKHAIPSHSAITHMTDVIFKGVERAYAAHLKIVASSSVIAGRFQWKGAELRDRRSGSLTGIFGAFWDIGIWSVVAGELQW